MVRSKEEIELYRRAGLSRLSFGTIAVLLGDVDVKEADGIGIELFLVRLVAFDLR